VLDVRGGEVVIEAAPVVPGQLEHGVVPVPGGDDGVDGLPDLVLAAGDVGDGVLVVGAVVPDRRQLRQVGGVGDDPIAADDVR